MTYSKRRPTGAGNVLAIFMAAFVLIGPRNAAGQTIQGRLLDAETDRPIDLGLVILYTEGGDSITSTVTSPEGRFSLSAPDSGSFALLASALGYHETVDGIFELGEDALMTVDFRIAPEPMPIDELVVTLSAPVQDHRLVQNGFVRRAQRGLGHFLTPKDIEESPARETEALLEHIPGVMVSMPRSAGGVPVSHLGEQVQMRSAAGGICTPEVFVDGIRVQYDMMRGLSLSTLTPLKTVDAVEVYRRPAEVPVEYGGTQRPRGPDTGTCGVILLWTKGR